jgi:short subunit fatty acids transporter
MIRLLEYLSENSRVLRFLLYGAAVIILIWSVSVDTSHAHTWAEKYIPGFWSLFGFVSCLVLVFVSGWLAKAGLSREEGYYDD